MANINFLALTGLINFLTCLFCGFLVFIRNPLNSENRSFFYFALSISLFSFGYFLWQLSVDQAAAFFWFKVLTVGIILINLSYLYFTFIFVGVIRKKKIEMLIYAAINLVFIFLCITSRLYTHLEPRYGLGLWPAPTPIFNIYLAFWFWQLFYGYFWLIQGWRHSVGIRREQCKYLSTVLIIAFLAGACNWPMWYKIHFPPYLNILISLYVALSAHIILRYRSLNIALFTAKGTFFVAYGFIFSIPYTIGQATGQWMISAILAGCLGLLGPAAYRFLITRAEDRIFAEQRLYQEMLRKTASHMLAYSDIRRLVTFIVQSCADTVNLRGACIYLRDGKTGDFKLAASSKRDGAFMPNTMYADHPLIRAMDKADIYLNMEAVSLGQESVDLNVFESMKLVEFSKKNEISLVLLIRSDTGCLGFLALGPKANKAMYSTDDIDTFTLLAYQSALAIDNCRHIEEMQDLYKKAVTDELTGCYNRAFFEEYMKRLDIRAENNNNLLSFIMIDIDNFKKINDIYGHKAGDIILQEFGKFLRMSFRESDMIFRYGGDEFSVSLEGITTKQSELIAERFMVDLKENEVLFDFQGEEIQLFVSVSMGIAGFKKGQNPGDLVLSADKALYQAKRFGRSRVVSE